MNGYRVDFGYSLDWNAPVSTLIWDRLAITLALSTASLIITWIIAIPVGVYTYNSVKTRVSTMRKIFREGLNVKALATIVDNPASKLDKESINYARELLELT